MSCGGGATCTHPDCAFERENGYDAADPLAVARPRHGDKRNPHSETRYGKHVDYFDARTGETVYSGPLTTHTQTVHERYCERCGEWRTLRGLEGFLWPACPSCGAAFEEWMREDMP